MKVQSLCKATLPSLFASLKKKKPLLISYVLLSSVAQTNTIVLNERIQAIICLVPCLFSFSLPNIIWPRRVKLPLFPPTSYPLKSGKCQVSVHPGIGREVKRKCPGLTAESLPGAGRLTAGGPSLGLPARDGHRNFRCTARGNRVGLRVSQCQPGPWAVLCIGCWWNLESLIVEGSTVKGGHYDFWSIFQWSFSKARGFLWLKAAN